MHKYAIQFLCLMLLLAVSGCTVYTEKQSEAISQTVYATKDSLDKARIDLADQYAEQIVRIIKPPKKRIEIQSVYKTQTIEVIASQSKPGKEVPKNKQRVVIIPEKYKNDTVVVVSSIEYQELLKDKETHKRLETDYKNLQNTKLNVDAELRTQQEFADQMIKDLNVMQKKLVEKDLAILHRNIVIVVLLLTIAGATYLRIKGIL
jgi:hypothetical protein